MPKETAVIILAAGKGTRMKSSMPKVLHPICGKPMIGHVLDISLHLNPSEIVTVLSEGMNDVAESIGHICHTAIQKEQLGTADAVKPALEKLKGFDGNIIILYADTPLIEVSTLKDMLLKLEDSDVAVLGFRPEDPAEYGRLVVNESGDLEKIVEYKDATATERKNHLCNSGVIGARSEVLFEIINKISNDNAKGEYYLTDLISLARDSGKKCGYIESNEDEVLGVNNRVQLSEAEYICQQRLRYAAMIEGATLFDPETVYFSHDTKIGKDVVIHPNVTFGPGVWIDDKVEIKSFCHIEEARISRGCSVGPFARIRPGTELESGAHIGNFVEIKKSKIGKGAKIGHLTYIGDAEIGDKANIGAGTVTCNYDGYNKYKTQIGEGAFIGSNSALVAPVTIGKGAFIGAGSTITKNIDDYALAVARNRQINKENWAKRKQKAKE